MCTSLRNKFLDITANCSPERERSRAQREYLGVLLGTSCCTACCCAILTNELLGKGYAPWSWDHNFANLIYVSLTVAIKLHQKP